VARTSAAPGKTRLANVYRVTHGAGAPMYLLDLPGYGYARAPREGRGNQSAAEARQASQAEFEAIVRIVFERKPAGLVLVDVRHPGLANDCAAWDWIHRAAPNSAIVATKIDKLARGERIRALKELESVFVTSVLPVSAVTGEGLDQLWTLIDRLAKRG
jgi:GTP-binding protein